MNLGDILYEKKIQVVFSSIKGKIFQKVYKLNESIIFENENENEKYELCHLLECSEDVYIEDICGDLSNLENAEITFAEESFNKDKGTANENWGSHTWSFYKLATIKGWVDIRFYGESNGWYSESAELYKIVNNI